jgi:hypothetical protein
VSGGISTAGGAATPGDAATEGAGVARRLALLEDRAAIDDLMVRYNRACDAEAAKGSMIAACFTLDGRWSSIGPHGNPDWAAVGRPALVAKFDRNTDRMPFSAHFVTNGTVTVDGDGASGRWAYFQTATYRDGTALWIAGTYLADLCRVEDEWLIDRLQVHNWFTTPYASGWAEVEHIDTP